MATKFTAFIWPPLVFPKAVNTGKLATLPPVVFPPSVLSAAPVSKVSFQAATPMPNTTTYIPVNRTANGILNFFSIVPTTTAQPQ